MKKREEEVGSEVPLLLARAHQHYGRTLVALLNQHGLAETLTPGMGNPLFALFAQNGQTLTEISASTSLSLSTLSELLTRMERVALVCRQKDAGDARLTRFWLTESAQKLRPACFALNQEFAEIMLQDLSREERKQFGDLLLRVVSSLSHLTKESFTEHP